jgi:hypothetical protein
MDSNPRFPVKISPFVETVSFRFFSATALPRGTEGSNSSPFASPTVSVGDSAALSSLS